MEVKSDTVVQQTSHSRGPVFRVHETWRKGTTHSLSIIFHVTWMDNTPRHRGHGQHPHLSPDLDHTDYFSTRVTYLADK